MNALRLLCDEMLKGVGRWLRAAGHDVAFVEDGSHDRQLLARARSEGRLLLTCDRRLAPGGGDDAGIVVLGTESPEGAARELGERLGVDWLHAPFTRCLLDNAPLMPAREEDVVRIPPVARTRPGPILRCPDCDRVYWSGSHVRRMRAKLVCWQAGRPGR